MNKKTRIIFLIAGAALLFALFATFGIKKPVEQIIAFGSMFWVCVLIYFANQLFLSYGWMILITHPLRMRQYWNVLLARIAGDATTTVSAAAGVAGDALKAIYLDQTVPFKIGLASVFLDRTVHMAGNTLLILFGIFIGFFVLAIPLWVLLLLFFLFTLVLCFFIFIVKKQKHGILQSFTATLPKPIRTKVITPARLQKIKELDKEITLIFKTKDSKRRFYLSLLMHTVPVMLSGTLEIYLIVIYSGAPTMTLVDAMFTYLVGLFISSAVFFIPMSIGTSEGSYSLALSFLGYPPEIGITVGMLRRFRALVWSGIGLLLLFNKGLAFKKIDKESLTKKSKILSNK